MAALKWAGLSMLGLSVIAGMLAVRSIPAPSVDEPEAPNHPVVVARRVIASDEEIDLSTLEVVLTRRRPSGGFATPGPLVGRIATRDIEAGEAILEQALSPLSALVRALRPGETAVAVEVDRVTGLGGFARPGDAVDVLFLLRRDGREVQQTQARTLLREARLLTFGTRVDATDAGEPTLNARTAVLAVPEADAPRLLLADVVGTLRLALRTKGRDVPTTVAPTITLGELLERMEPKTEAPSRLPRAIPVIRGGARR